MPAKCGRDAVEREHADADAVGADAHHARALLVVADEVDVCTEPVPVQQDPEDDCESDHPEHLGGHIAADPAGQEVGDEATWSAGARGVGADEYDAGPEEPRADRRHERRDAEAHDDHAVEEADAQAGGEPGDQAELGLRPSL